MSSHFGRSILSLRAPRDRLARPAIRQERGTQPDQREEYIGRPRRKLARLHDGQRRVEDQPRRTNDVRHADRPLALVRDHPETQSRGDHAHNDR